MLFNSKQALLCITLLFPGYQLAMENGISLQNQSKWVQCTLNRLMHSKGTKLTAHMSFSPDSKVLATTANYEVVEPNNGIVGEINLWNLFKKGIGRSTVGNSWLDRITNVDTNLQYSPDGSLMVYATGLYIRIYNTKTNIVSLFNEINFRGHTKEIISVQFSNCGQYILSASRDSLIKIWDLTTGECLRTISVDSGLIFAAYSSDDKSIITASQQGAELTIKIIDISTENCVKTFRENDYMGHVIYSPKGKFVAFTHGGKVKIWDMHDDIRTFVDSDPTKTTFIVASLDGNFLVSGEKNEMSHPTKLKIWDVKNGSCLQTIEYHPSTPLVGACFSPDSKLLATAYNDGTIFIWENQNIVTSNETLPAQQISIGQQQQQAQQQLAKAEQAMRQLQATKRQVQQAVVNEAKEEDVSQQNRQQQVIVESSSLIQPQQEIGKCLVCTNEKPATEFYKLSCGHEFCINCLNTIIDKDANERLCPDESCKQPIKRLDVTKIGYTYLLGKTTKALAKTTRALDSLKEEKDQRSFTQSVQSSLNRYSHFEIRLLFYFLDSKESAIVLQGREFDLFSLLRDGILQETSKKIVNSIGMLKEYSLTEHGKLFIEKNKTYIFDMIKS